MLDNITHDSVQIARLEERLLNLERDISAQDKRLAQMANQLDAVLEALSEAKGGWKTLMWLGGAGSAFGAATYWILSHVRVN